MSENGKAVNPDRIFNVLSLFNSSLEVDEVLHNILDKTAEILKAEATSLLLIDRSENRLFFYATTGAKAAELKDFKLEMGEGIAGWVAQNGETLCVPDVSKDPRFNKKISEKIDFETKSILCVPMQHQDKTIGVIELVNKEGGGQFTKEDVHCLETIAFHAAIAVENARKHGRINQENLALKEELFGKTRLIGQSPVMQKITQIINKVSPTSSTLLIRGESGTGKEVVARTIHMQSPRREQPFVCVTCSIYNEHLLESELFGHEKGAYTGAADRKIGRFEMANKGTVFLDEIGTVSLSTQVKLLRFLQEKEFERVGGTKTIRSDVRIIAATNEDLEKAIAQGRFREDLYYRLKVIEIDIPPLRERREDIALLAEHFRQLVCRETGKDVQGFKAETLRHLNAYGWPGNIRELKNVVERAVVLSSGKLIAPEDLPHEIVHKDEGSAADDALSGEDLTLEELQRRYIEKMLAKNNGNKSKTAKMLGISRNRLERKLSGEKEE